MSAATPLSVHGHGSNPGSVRRVYCPGCAKRLFDVARTIGSAEVQIVCKCKVKWLAKWGSSGNVTLSEF